MKKKTKRASVITDYDENDTTSMIDRSSPVSFEDLGLKLPEVPPTQVISIRLPTALLNEIKALGSRDDVPYQALIKIFLAEAVQQKKSKPKRSAWDDSLKIAPWGQAHSATRRKHYIMPFAVDFKAEWLRWLPV